MKLRLRSIAVSGAAAAALLITACQPSSVAPTPESPPNTQDMELGLAAVGFKSVSCAGTSTIRCQAEGLPSRPVSVKRAQEGDGYRFATYLFHDATVALPGGGAAVVNTGPSQLGPRVLMVKRTGTGAPIKAQVDYAFRAIPAKNRPQAQDVRVAVGLQGTPGDGAWVCEDLPSGKITCRFGTNPQSGSPTLVGTPTADTDADGGGGVLMRDVNTGEAAYNVRTWARKSGVRGVTSTLINGQYGTPATKYWDYPAA